MCLFIVLAIPHVPKLRDDGFPPALVDSATIFDTNSIVMLTFHFAFVPLQALTHFLSSHTSIKLRMALSVLASTLVAEEFNGVRPALTLSC